MSSFLRPPWTVAHEAPLSMGFSRQEYWSGLPFLSPEDLPDPGIEPGSPALQAGSLPFEPQGSPCLWYFVRAARTKIPPKPSFKHNGAIKGLQIQNNL